LWGEHNDIGALCEAQKLPSLDRMETTLSGSLCGIATKQVFHQVIIVIIT